MINRRRALQDTPTAEPRPPASAQAATPPQAATARPRSPARSPAAHPYPSCTSFALSSHMRVALASSPAWGETFW